MPAKQNDPSSENEAANETDSVKGEKTTDSASEGHIDIDVYDETPSGPSVTIRHANRGSS